MQCRDEYGTGGPRRRLPARTFENFRNNKQIVSPSLQQATVACSTAPWLTEKW